MNKEMLSRMGRVGVGALVALVCPVLAAEMSTQEAMDGIVTRIYATMSEDERAQLDDGAVHALITEEERSAFATKHWYFDASVPVIVSVLREKGQAVVPFWIEESGFAKTDLTVKNVEGWQYEVWQKEFDAGHVGLGINGFDSHGPHYLVAVGPQQPGAEVELSNFFPANQTVLECRPGAMTYHDWTELLLAEVPSELEGHALLTTIRGRAREAHLIGAFRSTPYPSSTQPDQIVLTWNGDPRTAQAIQWRTSTKVNDGLVRYREAGSTHPYTDVKATLTRIEDRLLANDRYIHHFTAVLHDLKAGTRYAYKVGSLVAGVWSDEAEFATAPSGREPFTFVYMGDSHNRPEWGELLTTAFDRHPETAFYAMAGDFVGTGLHRNDWDRLLEYSGGVFAQRPLVPAIGNHDDHAGLGAGMYLDLFALPENGPPGYTPERTYSFEYGNVLFMSLAIGTAVADQVAWLEKQLSESKATWRFVMFHFPPYVPDEDYSEIRREWGHLFDKYHVDMVLTGHVHYYLRTHPMNKGKQVASPADGTIYVTSVAIPSRELRLQVPDYAAVAFGGPALYQTFDIDGNRLTYRVYDLDGRIHDELVIEKP